MNAALLAPAAAAVAVGLLLAPRPRVAGHGLPRPRGAVGAVLAAASLTAMVLVAPARVVVLAVVAALAGAGAARLLHRRRARATAATRRAAVAEIADQVAAELRAGAPPGLALERVAREWPEVTPVARAHLLGGDVPTAWRLLAARPGGGDLTLLAAAWQVAQASGAGLAEVVGRIAALARASEATARVVASELASARATARLMAGLPLLALVMGSGLGGNPAAFLVTTPVGLGCLAGGLALGLAGLWWIEVIADDVSGDRRRP